MCTSITGRRIAASLLVAVLAGCANQPSQVGQPTPAHPSAQPNHAPTTAVPPTAVRQPPTTLATAVPTQPATTRPTSAPAVTPTTQAIANGRIIYTRFDEAQARVDVRSMASDGSDDRVVTSCADPCAISSLTAAPHGTQLAYVAESANAPTALHVVNEDGTDDRVLVEHDAAIASFGFAPDGTRLAYALSHETEGMGFAGSIWVTTPEGDQPRQLLPQIAPLGAVAWLDNDHLVYSESDGMGQLGGIHRLAISGARNPERLMEGVLRAVSPDGTQLLNGTEPIGHDITADQQFAHAIVTLQDGLPRVQHTFRWTVGPASWSPDGTTILHTGTHALELLHVATGAIDVLQSWTQSDTVLSGLAWDPSGTRIIYAVAVPGPTTKTELRRRSLAGGGEEVLATWPGAVGLALVVGATVYN